MYLAMGTALADNTPVPILSVRLTIDIYEKHRLRWLHIPSISRSGWQELASFRQAQKMPSILSSDTSFANSQQKTLFFRVLPKLQQKGSFYLVLPSFYLVLPSFT